MSDCILELLEVWFNKGLCEREDKSSEDREKDGLKIGMRKEEKIGKQKYQRKKEEKKEIYTSILKKQMNHVMN